MLGLTKALSEARMEASGLGQMADADKRAYFSKKLHSQLEAKRTALQQATSRRQELSQKLDQACQQKPKDTPQEKLKEALRIVAELTYSLSHTTDSNKNLREQLEVRPHARPPSQVSTSKLRANGRAVYTLQPYSLRSSSHQRVLEALFAFNRAWNAQFSTSWVPTNPFALSPTHNTLRRRRSRCRLFQAAHPALQTCSPFNRTNPPSLIASSGDPAFNPDYRANLERACEFN